ncbi:MAG TPA: glycosyltransferase, partial [bacterium]|nr:glycosyltransferase [bacterium]
PRQESTSQIDAAACGLPLILSNRVEVRERVEGNGFVYDENNPEDLARKIRILSDFELRQSMGKYASEKMKQLFSWDLIAKERLADYATAMEYGRAHRF